MKKKDTTKSEAHAMMEKLREDIIAAIIAATPWVDPAKVKPAKAPTEKEKRLRRIADAAAKVGGCQQGHLRELVEAMLGEPLPPPPAKASKSLDPNIIRHCEYYEPLTMVVPLRNPNGHSYVTGRPCLVIERGDRALKKSGEIGNHLPEPDREVVRYASPAEIREFVGALDSNITMALQLVNAVKKAKTKK